MVRILLRRQDEPRSANVRAPRHSFQQLCCLYLHPKGRCMRQRMGKNQQKTPSENAQQECMTLRPPNTSSTKTHDRMDLHRHHHVLISDGERLNHPSPRGYFHRNEGADQPTPRRARVILCRETKPLAGGSRP
jgi:hypothetical protein